MTMTKAHFKTTRESLGLNPRYLAEKIGCHPNILWRIESPLHKAKPSAAAMSQLQAHAVDFDMAADRIAAAARKRGHIERPATVAGFEAMVPELAGWPDRSHGLFLAEVQRRAHTDIDYTEA